MCSENPFLHRYLLTVTSLRETGQRALWVFFFFLAMPYGLWDLNSPTRDWTWGHGRELDSREFSLGPLMLLCFCLVNMLCPTFCHPMGSPPGSSVHGISQARILEQTEFPSPGFLPLPGIEPASPALTGGFFTTEPPGKCWGYVL